MASGDSPPSLISEDSAYYPDFGVNGSGAATVVWSQDSLTEYPYILSREGSGNTWGPIDESARRQRKSQFFPRVAVNSSGEAVAAWSQCYYSAEGLTPEEILTEELKCLQGEGEYLAVISRRNGSGGEWSTTPVTLTTKPQNAIKTQVAIDGSGNAVIAWEDATAGKVSCGHLAERRLDRDKTALPGRENIGLAAGILRFGRQCHRGVGQRSHRLPDRTSTLQAGKTTWTAQQPISDLGSSAFDPRSRSTRPGMRCRLARGWRVSQPNSCRGSFGRDLAEPSAAFWGRHRSPFPGRRDQRCRRRGGRLASR